MFEKYRRSIHQALFEAMVKVAESNDIYDLEHELEMGKFRLETLLDTVRNAVNELEGI